jgi:hypothetical protein
MTIVVTIVAAGACGGIGDAPSGPTASSAPAASATRQVLLVTPTFTPIPSASATLGSSALADRPPDALLSSEGGDPVAGQLGSYTWAGGGSDSPWLPGAPIAVGRGEPLQITLQPATAVASWAARRNPATATSGSGATALGEGTAVIAFPAPGPGAWTVEVTIRFTGGGSATYAWRLDVS